MIEQVLNRDFVLNQLDSVGAILERGIPQAGSGNSLPVQHDHELLQAAAKEVRAAAAAEKTKSSGPRGYDAPIAERRGESPAPIDDVAFLSHDPVISLTQSALEEFFETQRPQLLRPISRPNEGRRGIGGDDLIADLTLFNAPKLPPKPDGRRVFGPFSETDPRWIASKVAEGIRLLRGRHAFNSSPSTPIVIDNRARLILVGDWGSGLPRARKVAGAIRKVLDEGKQNKRQQHLVHLGDVYYSGWQWEYKSRFLANWPVRADEANEITSWSLNGNHDMYSGGHGYFDYLLADSRFARQERSSYFSMYNDYWQILGLDTAYEDGGLFGPQAEWVRLMLEVPNKKSMLLSHHQLFSVYENVIEQLQERLQVVLNGPKPINAWFWGHEHRCVFYKPAMNVQNARLIGHGGVPVYMFHKKDDVYPEPACYEYREFISRLLGVEHFALFGFAVLDFDGPQIQVRYIDEFGREHKQESIE